MANKKNFQALWAQAISNAKHQPGVWTTLESNRANANRVSEFRSNRYPFLLPGEFDMRSYKMPSFESDTSKYVYNIEIMAIPETTQEAIVDRDSIRDEVRRRLEPAFESIVDEMVEMIERRTQNK